MELRCHRRRRPAPLNPGLHFPENARGNGRHHVNRDDSMRTASHKAVGSLFDYREDERPDSFAEDRGNQPIWRHGLAVLRSCSPTITIFGEFISRNETSPHVITPHWAHPKNNAPPSDGASVFVEAAGIEPASGQEADRTSTCLA